jgi:glycosyltransferase involved in cell wall biosynthesis
MHTPIAPRPSQDQLRSVCLITGEYPPAIGGIADYTQSLARALSRKGLSVNVCTSIVCTSIRKRNAPAGAEADPPVLEVSGWDVGSLGEIAAAVAAVRPDVIHLQYQAGAFGMSPALAALPFVLRARCRAPFVTTFHDLRPPYLFPKAGPLRRWFNHALIGASDGVLFTDPADLARAHSRRPVFWVPIGSSLAPRDVVDRRQARRDVGIRADEAVVASFGFANASKGMDTLLRAGERLLRAGAPLRLLLIGDETGSTDRSNRETAEQIRALARSLDLEDRILRTGHLPGREVSIAMAAADLAALPYVDGASLRRSALLACFAHGLPVVTTTPASTPDPPAEAHVAPFLDTRDVRIDGRVVALVPPGDDAALAREIYRLLDDPARRHALGAAGQQLARRLDWDGIATATITVYRRVRRDAGL